MDKERIRIMLKEYPSLFSRVIVSGIEVDKLLKKSALIVGAGGLGVLVAEILARTGIGKLVIIDRDKVSEENFNRLGYNREDIGKNKAEALKQKIERLRNDPKIPKEFHIKVEAYAEDIIAWEKLEHLIKEIDIVFTCVDNATARSEVNYYAMKWKKPMIDGATSVTALSGTILTIIPCESPCYECHYSPDTTVKIDNFERVGQCDASLAHVMATIASIQADQGLRVLLEKDGIYNMIKVHFDRGIDITKIQKMKPRPDCAVHKKFCK